MPGELIITNGESAAGLLKAAKISDTVLPWRDVLHEGSVPFTDTLEDLSAVRSRHLSDAYPSDDRNIGNEFSDRDAALRQHGDFDLVTLWFEHDLYDQLQLIQILDWFSSCGRTDGSLRLVQTDTYLGERSPDDIGELIAHMRDVTGMDLDIASKAWTAFRQPSPEAWAGLLQDNLSALPFLSLAVRRMLEELPLARHGVTRTEQQILALLDSGSKTAVDCFKQSRTLEDAAFMGDWGFFQTLEGLCNEPGSLIGGLNGRGYPWPEGPSEDQRKSYLQSRLHLTPLGKDVLTGAQDYAALTPIDRWWAGTHLVPEKLWRWESETSTLIAPHKT